MSRPAGKSPQPPGTTKKKSKTPARKPAPSAEKSKNLTTDPLRHVPSQQSGRPRDFHPAIRRAGHGRTQSRPRSRRGRRRRSHAHHPAASGLGCHRRDCAGTHRAWPASAGGSAAVCRHRHSHVDQRGMVRAESHFRSRITSCDSASKDYSWKGSWQQYSRGVGSYVADAKSGKLWGSFRMVRITDRSGRPWRVLLSNPSATWRAGPAPGSRPVGNGALHSQQTRRRTGSLPWVLPEARVSISASEIPWSPMRRCSNHPSAKLRGALTMETCTAVPHGSLRRH